MVITNMVILSEGLLRTVSSWRRVTKELNPRLLCGVNVIHKGWWKQTDILEWSYPCPDTQVSWMIDHKCVNMNIITSMKRKYNKD